VFGSQVKLKKFAKLALIALLLNIVRYLIGTYRTEAQLTSPLIPSSTIWEINKHLIFLATISAVASVLGVVLYFYQKYLLIVIITIAVLVAGQFIHL
jgi:hypothetical protein